MLDATDTLKIVPLWTKMRDMADRGHPHAAELRDHASTFQDLTTRVYNGPQPPHIAVSTAYLAFWAAARRLYEDCGGARA